MIEIFSNGELFKNIVSEASLIKEFKRDSYALRYKDKNKELYIIAPYGGMMNVSGDLDLIDDALRAIWKFNLNLGGVHAKEDVANIVCESFERQFGGSKTLVGKDLSGATYSFKEGKIKRALFAGGCFWCIAGPYYEQEGVLNVWSGYAGGTEINPSYEEVKAQLTHHKECILVEYDSSLTDYTRMVDIYFEHIDPFDEGGQFIDRGDSYSPAVFTSIKEEKNVVIEYKFHLSLETQRECKLPILENVPFFMAEEEHQNYALKNPEEFEKELIESGRKKL